MTETPERVFEELVHGNDDFVHRSILSSTSRIKKCTTPSCYW